MKHEHHGYGMFPGGDPRRFSPDGLDSNSPEEIAKHKAACAEWNAREKAGRENEEVAGAVHGQLVDPASGEVKGSFIACGVSGFGMGAYAYDCDDPDCPEGQPPPLDPTDAYAAFEHWFSWDAQVYGVVVEGEATPDERKEAVRMAFIAGFAAGEKSLGREDE